MGSAAYTEQITAGKHVPYGGEPTWNSLANTHTQDKTRALLYIEHNQRNQFAASFAALLFLCVSFLLFVFMLLVGAVATPSFPAPQPQCHPRPYSPA